MPAHSLFPYVLLKVKMKAVVERGVGVFEASDSESSETARELENSQVSLKF